MFEILNMDNMDFNKPYSYSCVFADMIYESLDFNWIDKYWNDYLIDNGIFVVMTDWHTVGEVIVKLKSMPNAKMINHLVWKNEWGSHPKDRFHQCFDDILIFSKKEHLLFFSEKIQVNKVTKNKGLNPSGRQTKQATAWIDDICLTTTSKERIKKEDGHLVKWQKPLSLIERILNPFLFIEDSIIDPFMGSGVVGRYAIKHSFDYTGIEIDKDIFKLAKNNLPLDK